MSNINYCDKQHWLNLWHRLGVVSGLRRLVLSYGFNIAECIKKIDKPLKKLNICDDYSVFDLDMTDDLLSYVDEYDRFPDAILMPDLSLIRATGKLSDWKNKFKEILKQYSENSFSLILDCHV